MTQRSQLPKFGNWENEDNVPYTVYFENARKGKSGNRTNPSNPNMDLHDSSPGQVTSAGKAELEVVNGPETGRSGHKRHMSREDGEPIPGPITDFQSSHQHHAVTFENNNKSESEANKVPDGTGPSHQRRLSGEDGDIRKPYNSPLRHDNIGKKDHADSPQHRSGSGGTASPKRVSRQNLRPDRSVEQSPLHPHHQTRTGNKGSGVSSPSWERKGSSEGTHGLAPFTPGRSRLRSSVTGGGDETPDHGPVVPKFGDWDESDPSAGEGYTHIFNKVREEKQSETGKVPVVPAETSYTSNGQKQYANGSSKGCFCFPWGKK